MMKNALEFAGSIPLDATGDEIQRIAVAEFKAESDPDLKMIETERTDAHRLHAMMVRTREILGNAWKGGMFKDITTDREDLVLLLDYLQTVTVRNAVRWSAISDSLAPEPFDSE